ncbi:Fungal lipase-type domain-containing protein [Entamoeba marina]
MINGINSWFYSIQPDLLHLIKRSYTLTKRKTKDRYADEELSFLKGSKEVILETGHCYQRDKSFTGVHGIFDALPFSKKKLRLKKGEVDFPGFVALFAKTKTIPYHIICVIFRGSQSETFQAINGKLGPSWVTNFDATPIEVNEEEYGFEGRVHGGFLKKLESCNYDLWEMKNQLRKGLLKKTYWTVHLESIVYTLNQSIRHILFQIPENERNSIRFVISGHSQGGATAQIAFPYIIRQFGRFIPQFIDNIETPYFVGYFLSTPKVAADSKTAINYTIYVGEDNMISHFTFRDAVTMASLPKFKIMGIQAIDSVYDTLYKGILSEIASDYRPLLIYLFKNKIEEEFIDKSNPNNWKLNVKKENLDWETLVYLVTYLWFSLTPNIILCTSLITTILQNNNQEKKQPFQELLDVIIKALEIRSTQQEKLLFNGDENFFLFKPTDWYEISQICLMYISKRGITLDKSRCIEIKRIEKQISCKSFKYSKHKEFDVAPLEDVLTNCDLCKPAKGFGFTKQIKLYFRYHHYKQPTVKQPYLEAIPGIPQFKTTNFSVSPAGKLQLFFYLHYSTSSTISNQKCFDSFVPSRNLQLAIENGKIISENKRNCLQSECPFPH